MKCDRPVFTIGEVLVILLILLGIWNGATNDDYQPDDHGRWEDPRSDP